MVYFFIGTMLFVLYSGVVWATYLKFKYNGIGLNIKYKMYMLLLPLFILYMHIRLSIGFLKTDKRKSWYVLKYAFTKYPILIGNLIEIIKENMAECDVFGDSRLLKVKKRESNVVDSPIRDVLLNLREIFNHFRKGSAYEREL